MLKAIAAAVVVYLLSDPVADFFLEPLGLEYFHAFIAMFCGMFVGGFLSTRNFIWVALGLNLFFSGLTYVVVGQMREQSPLDLALEQHLMVSLGSFAGAVLGAWLGGMAGAARRATQG